MSLKKVFRILFVLQLSAGICLTFLVLYLYITQQNLSRSRQIHFQSFLLADELRQSSDDLTRLARTYVATLDEKYERQYWDVLAIRNGKIPRPKDYNRIYWDFMAADGKKPRKDDKPISLHELMISEGFTKAEFSKLSNSQKYSDELVNTERIAMNAVKGLFADASGNFTVKKKPNQALAIKLMNDETYHRNKANIMRPIDEFYIMIEKRTTGEVHKYEQRAMNLLLLLGVLIILIVGMFAYSFIVIQRQIVKREKAEEDLRATSVYSRNLLETSVDPLVTISADGKITDVNKATEIITGIEREKLIGTDFSSYFTEPEKAHAGYLKAFQKGKVIDYPLAVRNVNGNITEVIYNASVYRNELGEVEGVFAAARDITERKFAEMELEKYRNNLEELVVVRTNKLNVAYQELAVQNEKEKQYQFMLKQALDKEIELSNIKSNLITTVSHEFRTPLTTILSSTELLQRYRNIWSDERKDEHVERIRKQIHYLTKLLNDILLIGKIEGGKIMFNPQPVNLRGLLRDYISDLPALKHESHEMVFNYLCETEDFILDEKLIGFIINNLLSNAFKFSPIGGRVELNVSFAGHQLKIGVSDQGIGIPSDEIDLIFQSFGRASNVDTISGNGLGLTIVKRSVELHGGIVSVESELGKGTIITVIIPIQAVA